MPILIGIFAIFFLLGFFSFHFRVATGVIMFLAGYGLWTGDHHAWGIAVSAAGVLYMGSGEG